MPWAPPPGGGATRPWLPQPSAESATRPWLPQPPPTRAVAADPSRVEVEPQAGARRLRVPAAWTGAGLAVIAGAAVLFVVLEGGPAVTPGNGGGTEADGGGPGNARAEPGGGRTMDSSKVDSLRSLPAGIDIDPTRAENVLIGLLDVLTGYGSSAVPAATLEAVHDTARAIYGSASVTSLDRALAAYLLANYFWIRGERRECRDWMENAMTLDPGGPGYRQLLERCSSGAP